MNVPSSPETPPPKVNWLRFCSWTLKVTSSLSSPEGRGLEVRRSLHRLEVAELVDAADGDLQGLGVEDVALVHVDLATDHLVARRVVAR